MDETLRLPSLAVFYLTEARQNVVGRVDWIYHLDVILAKSLNNRINRNQIHTIFWSKDISKKPTFEISSDVHLRSTFHENEDALYRAKIVKCFGKLTFK